MNLFVLSDDSVAVYSSRVIAEKDGLRRKYRRSDAGPVMTVIGSARCRNGCKKVYRDE